MKFITASSGRIVEQSQLQRAAAGRRIVIGVSGLDEIYGSGFVRGAVHELLHPLRSAKPTFPAILLAKAVIGAAHSTPIIALDNFLSPTPDLSQLPDQRTGEIPSGVIVISDPKRKLYPPAAAQLGIPLARLYLLHPSNREQELWAIAECLASAGVCAVVAELGALNQVEARRLQLAAERGGSVGIFIRPATKSSSIYAAATRMLVTPASPTAIAQRWNLQILHGHGCQVGKNVVLEYNREEHTVHTSAELFHHEAAAKTKAARATA